MIYCSYFLRFNPKLLKSFGKDVWLWDPDTGIARSHNQVEMAFQYGENPSNAISLISVINPDIGQDAGGDALKEKFTPKFLFTEKLVTIRPSQKWVCFFTKKKNWRNLALHQLLINGSSAVNGCRQNESPNNW